MNGDRKIRINNIIKDETAKASNKQTEFFNDLTFICIKNGLTSSEYVEVSEKVIRNIMQICDSRLKNSFANKRRYKEKMAAKKNSAAVAISKKPDGWIPPVGKFDWHFF